MRTTNLALYALSLALVAVVMAMSFVVVRRAQMGRNLERSLAKIDQDVVRIPAPRADARSSVAA